MTEKTIDTLIQDIDTLILSGVESPSEDVINSFGTRVASILRQRLTTKRDRDFTLRMSNIGKDPAQLWYESRGYPKDKELDATTLLKFLYGDVIEELLLTLAELAGHKVTERQREVELAGIKGHIDALIDGEVVDVKSASSFSYDRFESGTLKDNDAFGYYTQISGYAKALGLPRGHFLAMDKQMANTCLLTVPEMHFVDVAAKIDSLKEALACDTPPECNCIKKVEANGNEYLGPTCSYNPYKHHCHSGLRVFLYSTGPRFFTKVVKEPQVPEIVDGVVVPKLAKAAV